MAGHKTGWLVIAPQPCFRRFGKRLAVNEDFIVRTDIDCRAIQHFAIELYAAITDHALGIAARANTGTGNAFGDTLTSACVLFLFHGGFLSNPLTINTHKDQTK